MTARARLTQAEIARAIKAARSVDPACVIELVTGETTLRIMPPGRKPESAVDAWFAEHDDG